MMFRIVVCRIFNVLNCFSVLLFSFLKMMGIAPLRGLQRSVKFASPSLTMQSLRARGQWTKDCANIREWSLPSG